jgi:hypothetical protein
MSVVRSIPLLTPAPDEAEHSLRRRLQLVTIAWMFGAFWMWTVGGAAWTRFALGAGMPDTAFGLLTSLGYIAIMFQVPAAYILERWGHRKAIFIVGATIHRLLWVGVAAVPWVIPDAHKAWRWPAIAAMLLISNSLGNITGPAWMSWMADVIPKRVRGRYFSVRARLGQFIGVVATLVIGYVLDLVERAVGSDSQIMLKVTSSIIAIAGLVGALDILCFRPIPDKQQTAPKPDVNLWSLFREPLANRSFRWFMAWNFTFNVAVGFMGQYIWLFVLKARGMNNWKANLLVIALPLLAAMLTYGIWGRIMDRVGKKPLLVINSFLVIGGALGWIVIGKDWTPWGIAGYVTVLLTTAVWPGVEIAAFNIVLGHSGSSRSAPSARCTRCGGDVSSAVAADRQKCLQCGHGISYRQVAALKNGQPIFEAPSAGPAYVALNALAVALGGILSGLMASTVAGLIGERTWMIPVLGVALTYHGVLFILSFFLRLAAAFMTLKIEEPHSVGTRQAIGHVTDAFYSNVRQAAWAPIRVAGQAYRWTDHVTQRPRRRLRLVRAPADPAPPEPGKRTAG